MTRQLINMYFIALAIGLCFSLSAADTWYNFQNKSYFIRNNAGNSVNREEADQECRRRSTQLATLADRDTHNFIYEKLQRRENTNDMYYIGLRKGDMECTCKDVRAVTCEACRRSWRWDDGTPMSYYMWKDQRPQNVENRFCGGENSYKQFDSIPCESERSGFICQYNCSALGCHRTECTFHLESHYTCDCEDGYNTTHCDFEINECETNPCLHHANCTDSLNSYTCTCAPGFTGTNCETNIDECSSFPCSNNGSCKDSIDSYVCTCLSGFTGVVCETEANECESNPCAPGEMCVDLVGMYNCSCDENNGTSCEEGSNEHVCTGADCYVGMLRILQGVFATTVVASWTGFGIMVQRYYRKMKTEDEPVINVAEDMAVEETKQP